jgi:transcriptional regulator with XRE-family HTH domain
MPLRRARERAGLSIDEAAGEAKKLGVPVTTHSIERMESGRIRMEGDLIRLAGLSAAYRVKLRDLLSEDQREDACRYVAMFRDGPVCDSG